MADIKGFADTKERGRATAAVSAAIKRGELKRSETCAWCGTGGRIEAHHPDYARPLMVVWLCRSCHCAHHKAYSVERNLLKEPGTFVERGRPRKTVSLR